MGAPGELISLPHPNPRRRTRVVSQHERSITKEVGRLTAFLSVFKTRGRERLCLTRAHTRFNRHIPCINTALKRTRRYQVASETINAHSKEAGKGRVVPIAASRCPSAGSGNDRGAEGGRSGEIVKLQCVGPTTDFRTVPSTRLTTCTL